MWGGGVEVSVIISIQCLNTWYSSAGYGVFHCGIWGIPMLDMEYSTAGYGVFQCCIPLRDMGYSNAGYGVFHCGIWDMLLIGSDIEYIEMEDIHSYLDEIFPIQYPINYIIYYYVIYVVLFCLGLFCLGEVGELGGSFAGGGHCLATSSIFLPNLFCKF